MGSTSVFDQIGNVIVRKASTSSHDNAEDNVFRIFRAARDAIRGPVDKLVELTKDCLKLRIQGFVVVAKHGRRETILHGPMTPVPSIH